MKAAIYARVSTSDQQSIPAQLDLMRAYCKQREWEIVGEFQETESGKNDNRRERAKVMKLATSRKIDAVVVWKMNRWGRSTVDLLITIRELTDRGVSFVSVSEYIDLSTPVGKMVAGILALFAEFEREVINQNVKMGIAAYRARHDDWGRPATARKQTARVKALRREGKGASAIAKDLNISRASVYRLMKT